MVEPEGKDPAMHRDRARNPSTSTGNGHAANFVPTTDTRSVGALIRELADEGARLIREELRLAQTEMREKMEVYQENTTKLVVGGVLLLGAFGLLLVAVNHGLTVMLTELLSLEVAVWLAPLILASIAGIVGWSMVKAARKRMTEEGLTPTRTIESLREDKDMIAKRVREARNG